MQSPSSSFHQSLHQTSARHRFIAPCIHQIQNGLLLDNIVREDLGGPCLQSIAQYPVRILLSKEKESVSGAYSFTKKRVYEHTIIASLLAAKLMMMMMLMYNKHLAIRRRAVHDSHQIQTLRSRNVGRLPNSANAAIHCPSTRRFVFTTPTTIKQDGIYI